MRYALLLLVALLTITVVYGQAGKASNNKHQASIVENTVGKTAVISNVDWQQVDSLALPPYFLIQEEFPSQKYAEGSVAEFAKSFDQFLQSGVGQWRRYDDEYPGKAFTIVTLWAAVRMENTSRDDWNLVLENRALTTRDSSVFIVDGGQLQSQANFGQRYPLSESAIEHRFFLFLLGISFFA